MSDENILKRKGGRPCLPAAPQSSAETRALIAAEVVKTNPRTRTLQQLYRLLKSFVLAEDAARADAKLKALEDANRLKREELAHRKADYRLRFAQKPLGVRNLLVESERLRARVASLEAELAGVNSGSTVALPCGALDCGVMQDKSSES